MRTSNLQNTDRMPCTGGSGGGPNSDVVAPQVPGKALGLNSMVVYGGNIQIAFPINFQMAFGSNLQVCINPTALETLLKGEGDTASPLLNHALGAGMGGNMQLTMGMSANFVLGQIFDINLGPSRMVIDVNSTAIQKGCKVISFIIGALAIVVLCVYIIPNDDVRAQTLVLYQVAMQILLTLLMDLEYMYCRADRDAKEVMKKALGVKAGGDDIDKVIDGDIEVMGKLMQPAQNNWITAVAIVVVYQIPVLLESIGESKLDAQPADQPYDVVDSSTGAPILDSAGNKEVAKPHGS